MHRYIPNELDPLVAKLKALLKLEKAGCVVHAIQRIEHIVSELLKEAA
jgi:hypothetical protein